jgi:hypothetical protein
MQLAYLPSNRSALGLFLSTPLHEGKDATHMFSDLWESSRISARSQAEESQVFKYVWQ